MSSSVRMPAFHAAVPDPTHPTVPGCSCTPCRYAATKHPMPRITFMITPAEMITIRWRTGLFLKLRGSFSPSSSSAASPSPTMLTYPPSGMMPTM